MFCTYRFPSWRRRRRRRRRRQFNTILNIDLEELVDKAFDLIIVVDVIKTERFSSQAGVYG